MGILQEEQPAFEAHVVSVSDAGEALIVFSGGARMTLQLSEEQRSSYHTAKLRERARAGTLVASATDPTAWPADKVFEVVIGDSNWFYC